MKIHSFYSKDICKILTLIFLFLFSSQSSIQSMQLKPKKTLHKKITSVTKFIKKHKKIIIKTVQFGIGCFLGYYAYKKLIMLTHNNTTDVNNSDNNSHETQQPDLGRVTDQPVIQEHIISANSQNSLAQNNIEISFENHASVEVKPLHASNAVIFNNPSNRVLLSEIPDTQVSIHPPLTNLVFSEDTINQAQNLLEIPQPTQAHVNQQADQPPHSELQQHEAENIMCGNCNRLRGKNDFVKYCKECDTKICKSCDFGLANDGLLYLDKSKDYAFVKTSCFNCNCDIKLWGMPWLSQMRSYIFIERCKNDEHKVVYNGMVFQSEQDYRNYCRKGSHYGKMYKF